MQRKVKIALFSILGAIIFIFIAAFSLYVFFIKPSFERMGEEIKMELEEKIITPIKEGTSDTVAINIAAIDFWYKHDRWPTDINELLLFKKDGGFVFDRSQYSSINFLEKPDGDLLVELEFAPPSSGRVTGTVKPPKTEKGTK